MGEFYLISEAAKEVQVENHVLRYWEDELKLPIKRNEMGHRYYTKDDINRFIQIKDMKERGLQLKAIKMILKNGELNLLQDDANTEIPQTQQRQAEATGEPTNRTPMGIDIIGKREMAKESPAALSEQRGEDKVRRLQWLLQQMIKETIQENNEILLKELDYQFRVQEERDDERDRANTKRNEEYYARMDELLRKKTGKGWKFGHKKRKQTP